MLFIFSALAPLMGVLVVVPNTTSGYANLIGEQVDTWGRIYHSSIPYSTTIQENDAECSVGAELYLNLIAGSRVYYGFDVSSVPDSAEIVGVDLHLYVMPWEWSDEASVSLSVYTGWWGDSIDASDWGCGVNNGTLAGSKVVTQQLFGPIWESISLATTSINSSDIIQFELMTPDDPKIMHSLELILYSQQGEATSPYLDVSYRVPGSLTYELNDGLTHTANVFPEILEYNSTHELYKFEFDTWSDVNNVSIFKEDTWTFLNYTPYANSTTETDDYLNLTGVVTATYRVYFAVSTTLKTIIHLVLSYSETGEGIEFEKFRLRYSEGTSYNSSDTYNIASSTFEADRGASYTIAVMDYFNRIICTSSVVTNSANEYTHISVPITEVHLSFSDSRLHSFGLESEGVTVNFSASPVSLVSTYSYNLTVYEDQYIEENATTLPSFSGASDLIFVNVTLKNEPATVYFRYYDATGTHPGSGVAWETYSLYVDGEYQPFEWLNTVIDSSHEVVVLDYFSNELYNETVTVEEENELLEIGINTYSFKIMNAQVYDPVKAEIHFNDSGDWVGPHSFYSGPGEVVERFFRNGSYRVDLTYYSSSDLPYGTVYTYYNISGNASYLCIRENGTLYEITVDTSGFLEYNELITTLLTPDVVSIGENLPRIPNDMDGEECILIHPYSIVSGVRHYPNGTTEDFRTSTVFYYSYYTTSRFYTVTLTVNNSEDYNWTDVTWFVGFPENASIDYSSVRIYDLNNEVYLSPGEHYDMTLTGIRMAWDYFNTSLNRSFTFSFYDANSTSGQGVAIAYVDSYESSDYGGEDMWTSRASWTNPYSSTYEGSLSIRIDHEYGRAIDPDSIIIVDNIENRQLNVNEWTYSGNTIMISHIEAGVGEVYSLDLYYEIDYSASDSFDVFTPILVIGGMGIALFHLLVVAVGGLVAWNFAEYSEEKFILLLVLGSITVVLIALSYFMGG